MTDVFKDTTTYSLFFELVDSTTGLPKTGIVYTDVTGSYVRTRSIRVAISMATLAGPANGFSAGGFILIDDTNQPGIYRLDVPAGAFATGAFEVVISVKATGCRTVSRQINLVNTNNQVAAADDAILTVLGTPAGVSVSADIAAVKSDTGTLVSRVTTTVVTLWANLTAMISGSGGTAAFTTTALANAPAGGGGGSGDASQDTLLEVQDTVDAIALSLAGTSVTVVQHVSGSTITAYIGDDYRVRSGSELSILVSDSASGLYDKFVALGVGNLAFGASRDGQAAGEVEGTISSLSHTLGITTIKVEITDCGTGLSPCQMTYQIQSSTIHTAEYDDVVEVTGILKLKQRTAIPRT